MIRDGETGLLVNPRDAAGLKDAIARLLTDPDLCRRMGTQAQEWVRRHYTSSAMALQYRAMYEQVLGSEKPSVMAQGRPQDHPQAEVREA